MDEMHEYKPQTDFAFVRTLLVREVPKETPPPFMPSSRDVYEFATRLIGKDADKEEFWSLHLDGKHRIMAGNCISVGTMTASLVHPREVYRPAIAGGAVAIIVFHNHPSGDPTPSPEDIEITRRLAEVGHLVGIRLLDHVIIGDGAFASCYERGVFPE